MAITMPDPTLTKQTLVDGIMKHIGAKLKADMAAHKAAEAEMKVKQAEEDHAKEEKMANALKGISGISPAPSRINEPSKAPDMAQPQLGLPTPNGPAGGATYTNRDMSGVVSNGTRFGRDFGKIIQDSNVAPNAMAYNMTAPEAQKWNSITEASQGDNQIAGMLELQTAAADDKAAALAKSKLPVGTMTPDQKTAIATRMANGDFPGELYGRLVGFGGRTAGQFVEILQEAEGIAKKEGKTFSASKAMQDYNYEKNVITKRLKSNFDTVSNEIDKIEQLNKNVGFRSAFPLWNKASLAIQRFMGDGDTTEFVAGVELFKDSLSTILANGTMTDARLKIAQDSLSADMSPENFDRVLNNVVQVFTEYREKAVNAQGGKGGNKEAKKTRKPLSEIIK